MPFFDRRTSRLRWKRHTASGTSYFVTACTKDRSPVLCQSAPNLLSVFAGLHAGGDAVVHAATVMPDHLHLLFTLGNQLQLGQLVGKLKALSRRSSSATWWWQDDFFERRVRDGDRLEDYAFYIFMNPYRAGLVPLEAGWPWWFCPNVARFGFLDGLGDGKAVPEPWVEESRIVGRRLRSETS